MSKNLHVNKIYTSTTAVDMVDNCIQLIVKYGNLVNIDPEPHQDLIGRFRVYDRYGGIFHITETWSSCYNGWKCKSAFLGTPVQSGAYCVNQLYGIQENIGIRTGIHAMNPDVSMYELFNKMDTLFCLCDDKVKGLNKFSKDAKIQPTKTSMDNLIIETWYPDYEPKDTANVCTRLINEYGSQLDFVPVDNPNKFVKSAITVYKAGDREKRIFAVCKIINDGFAIARSGDTVQIADIDQNQDAIPVFQTLFNLCRGQGRQKR